MKNRVQFITMNCEKSYPTVVCTVPDDQVDEQSSRVTKKLRSLDKKLMKMWLKIYETCTAEDFEKQYTGSTHDYQDNLYRFNYWKTKRHPYMQLVVCKQSEFETLKCVQCDRPRPLSVTDIIRGNPLYVWNPHGTDGVSQTTVTRNRDGLFGTFSIPLVGFFKFPVNRIIVTDYPIDSREFY